MMLGNALYYGGPILLKAILLYLSSTKMDPWKGYYLASMFFLIFLIRPFL